MIGLILVTIQIKGRMLFPSLVLFMKKMIGAVNASLFQEFYNIGMIAGPSLFIPNSVAVEISGQDGACLFQVFPIMDTHSNAAEIIIPNSGPLFPLQLVKISNGLPSTPSGPIILMILTDNM